jgi:hypothetical protein
MRRFARLVLGTGLVVGLTWFGIDPAPGQSAKSDQNSPGKRLALVVGVNRYKHAKLDPLEFAERDAEELAKLPAKSRVLGVWTDKSARAYPESAFSRDRTRITEELDSKKLTIEYNPDARSLRVAEAEEGVHWMYSLWFAWYAFRPETEVFVR